MSDPTWTHADALERRARAAEDECRALRADRDTLAAALTSIPCRRVPGPPCCERVYDKTPCIRCAALARVGLPDGKAEA